MSWFLVFVFTINGHAQRIEQHGFETRQACLNEGWKIHDRKAQNDVRTFMFSCDPEKKQSQPNGGGNG